MGDCRWGYLFLQVVVVWGKLITSQHLRILRSYIRSHAYSGHHCLQHPTLSRVGVLCCSRSFSSPEVLLVITAHVSLGQSNRLREPCLRPGRLLPILPSSFFSSNCISPVLDVSVRPLLWCGTDTHLLCWGVENAAHCFLTPCGLLLTWSAVHSALGCDFSFFTFIHDISAAFQSYSIIAAKCNPTTQS